MSIISLVSVLVSVIAMNLYVWYQYGYQFVIGIEIIGSLEHSSRDTGLTSPLSPPWPPRDPWPRPACSPSSWLSSPFLRECLPSTWCPTHSCKQSIQGLWEYQKGWWLKKHLRVRYLCVWAHALYLCQFHRTEDGLTKCSVAKLTRECSMQYNMKYKMMWTI